MIRYKHFKTRDEVSILCYRSFRQLNDAEGDMLDWYSQLVQIVIGSNPSSVDFNFNPPPPPARIDKISVA